MVSKANNPIQLENKQKAQRDILLKGIYSGK